MILPDPLARAGTLRYTRIASDVTGFLARDARALLALRLPQDIEDRLERLAKRTGRTKTFYAPQAILDHLDDLEDLYLAEEAGLRCSGAKPRPSVLRAEANII
jgi:RHH-type transcriptional regulator, rel operon repressor / antitoxin RelB